MRVSGYHFRFLTALGLIHAVDDWPIAAVDIIKGLHANAG